MEKSMKNGWMVLCLTASSVAFAQSRLEDRQADYEKLYAAIRADDLHGLKILLRPEVNPDAADSREITPLMSASAVGSVDSMKTLIAYGADVNATNAFGSTALMWSASDAKKVKLLLDCGADVNKTSKAGRTALMVAALSNPSASIVRMLLAAGADPNVADRNGLTALIAAASGNDTATLRLLAAAGADVNVADKHGAIFTGATPLMKAAMNGNVEAVRFLLAKGAQVNAVSSRDKVDHVMNGPIALGGFTPLLLAAPAGSPDLIKTLLDAGASVNVTDIRGMTPLMLAAASDHQVPEVVRMLLAHGADPKAKSNVGETALDWARKVGAGGAIEALGGQKLVVSSVPVLEDAPGLRPALERSVSLLERSTAQYFVKAGCVGCHAQAPTEFAVAAARPKKIPVDETAALARKQQMIATMTAQGPLLMERADPAAIPDSILFVTESLLRTSYAPDHLTDYAAAEIAATQQPEGNWHLGAVARPPMEDGDFTRTALAIRFLDAYGTPGRRPETKARIEKAKRWLLHAEPVTCEDRDMRLVGVAAAGGDPNALITMARSILEHQRPDGGWAQRDELASDAYATGMTLWALAEVGAASPSDDAYQRGVKFLLSTQRPDGSWFVASRAVKLQPYFESGFPYGHDQWISSMATGWAANALALAIGQ
jgi:ankyrin repeat protein